jgi:hypothetical protein
VVNVPSIGSEDTRSFDPHPTLRDLIALHEAAEREREPGKPIRVIRALAMTADGWWESAKHAHEPRSERRGYCDLMTLGRRLGVPVGKVLGGAAGGTS